MVSTLDQVKTSGKELLGSLIVHRRTKVKKGVMSNEKQDESSGGDRITTMELQVQALTTAVSNLINELSTLKAPHVCQVILGSPYLWDRDDIHYRRLRKYRLVKEEKEFHINACKPKATNRLMKATQAKRMVNASGGFVLLMIRLLERNTETIALFALSLTPFKCCDIKKLQEEFKDLFLEVHELPPRRAVEHEFNWLEIHLYQIWIAALLHSLKKANQRFEWTKKHGETFHLLKWKISKASVLALSNLQQPFEVEVDVSNYALGAVLFQDRKPVAYHYEMFSGPVLNYRTYNKELYALHQAVKHWRVYLLGKEVYLLGKEVVVHSNHKPLQFLTT
ncbi:hypothetical protein Q3G72_020327 [Acer saccharum]|nr:hypothetical protein Q3G72_020327 [Acer saccharum]